MRENSLTDWVFEHSESYGDDRLVLLAVALDFDATLGCSPKFDPARIARRTKLSERNVQRAVDRLMEADRLSLAHGHVYLPRVP